MSVPNIFANQIGPIPLSELDANFAAFQDTTDPLKGVALVGGAGRVVTSITALRALPRTGSPQAFVSGYYAQGDGGGGTYYYDSSDTTSADNGGTIIVASDGGRWKLATTEYVSFKTFGARGNSNGTTGNGNDDTVFIQAAITWTVSTGGRYKINVDEGVFRCTALLSITGALSISGDGVSPYDVAIGTRGNGSWLYFDHTGKGITIDGAAALSGVELRNFGTLRNQPTPAPSWAPTAHDYDIWIDNSDVLLEDLMLLNPTKGVMLTNGNAGRLEINRLRGQAFQTMLRIDTSYDAVKINNLHQWPFWRDDTNVHTYTLSNLDAIYLERADNPMLMNVFTIFARSGLRFGQNANGVTSKMHLVNADFDRGVFGVWVDTTVTSGVTGQFVNVTHQGETGISGSKALYIEGNNSSLDFVNLRTDLCSQNAVRVDGATNHTRLSGAIRLLNYNQSAVGFPAIEPATGNTVRIDGLPEITGGGAGARYGGAGLVYVDEWRGFTPVVTAEIGSITTYTATGRYKLWNDSVAYRFKVDITTNGTGAGSVRATIPVAASTSDTVASIGNGRAAAISGKALQSLVTQGATQSIVYNYDNTYPGASGESLLFGGMYPV